MISAVVKTIGDKVLEQLVEHYYSGVPYYLSSMIFKDEEDSLFTTNEEIIDYIKKILSEKYLLTVAPIQRTFKSYDPNNEDFTFEDTELKIILNPNPQLKLL